MHRPCLFRSPLFLSAFLAVALTAFGAAAQAPRPGQAPPPGPQAQQPAPPKPYDVVPVTLPPPYNDPSFEAFRKQLADVAKRKDRAALANMVVARGFFWIGERGDIANRRRSSIDNLASAIDLDAVDGTGWEGLAEVAREPTLEQFTDRKGVMCGPASPTYDERAAEEIAKATGTESDDWGYPGKAGIEVRDAPRPDAPVIEKLGLNLVRVLPDDLPLDAPPQAAAYIRVVAPSGKVGFVLEMELLSLESDQMCYSKESGSWKIVGYIGE
jgi:hypothetical protein